jgi:hypothetical protein
MQWSSRNPIYSNPGTKFVLSLPKSALQLPCPIKQCTKHCALVFCCSACKFSLPSRSRAFWLSPSRQPRWFGMSGQVTAAKDPLCGTTPGLRRDFPSICSMQLKIATSACLRRSVFNRSKRSPRIRLGTRPPSLSKSLPRTDRFRHPISARVHNQCVLNPISVLTGLTTTKTPAT